MTISVMNISIGKLFSLCITQRRFYILMSETQTLVHTIFHYIVYTNTRHHKHYIIIYILRERLQFITIIRIKITPEYFKIDMDS